MTETKLTADDLTDDQIERVLNSRGFQKMLAYSKLADGIDVLEDEDELFESMIKTIEARHGSIRSTDSVREVLRLFCEEVETFTGPLVEDDNGMTGDDLEDLYVDDA